jgi:hypothetical protein
MFIFDLSACDTFDSCDTCLYNDLDCGWCGLTGTCHAGNTSGPTNGTCDDNRTWEFTVSRVISASGSDGVISPTNVEVFLRPGKNVTFPVSITVPFLPPLDMYFLMDASESMRRHIESVRSSVGDLVTRIKQLQNDTVFGLASFIEKPQMPFGGWPECYSYKSHSPLNANISLFADALDDLLGALRRNNEHPESSMDGALYASMDPSVGYRPGSFKIVMVVTDASSHVAGDGVNILGIHAPNNLDGVQDGYPPGSAEDYVSAAGLRSVFVSKDINPIWAAIDIITGTNPVFNFYRTLTNQLGFGSAVQVTVDSGGSGRVVDAVLNGTAEVLSKTVLAADLDPRIVIKRINPAIYTNVSRLATVTFNVTVMADVGASWIGSTANATAKYVGFGNAVKIVARTAVVCRGCDPNDPSKKLDRCGVCGGNNTCFGCDGVRDSGVLFDACGVCGGDNSTCRDCQGIVNGPSQFDVCGVCGGNGSSCAGCDGVPLSGAVVNECGECNGPPNCQAVRGAIIGLSALAGVAVIAAVAAAIFLAVGAAKMAAADTILFTQLNSLKENPLYKQAQSVRNNPFYKEK